MEKPVEPPADEPRQKTLKGTSIPVPKRGEVMDAFKKIARPLKRSDK